MQKNRLASGPSVEDSVATGFPSVPNVSEKDLDLNMNTEAINPVNSQ